MYRDYWVPDKPYYKLSWYDRILAENDTEVLQSYYGVLYPRRGQFYRIEGHNFEMVALELERRRRSKERASIDISTHRVYKLDKEIIK